jgi:hypothetical protein
MCRESGGADRDFTLELVFLLRRSSVSVGVGVRGGSTGITGVCGITTRRIFLMAQHSSIAAGTTTGGANLPGPEDTEDILAPGIAFEGMQLRQTAVALSVESTMAESAGAFPHAVRVALAAFMAEDLAEAVFTVEAEAGAEALHLRLLGR